MLNNETISKIKDIINSLDNEFLYIVLGGSGSIKYIKNNKDIDIFVFCRDEEQVQIAKNKYRTSFNNQDIRNIYNLDIHIIEKKPDNFIYYLNTIWKGLGDLPQNFIDEFEDKLIDSLTIEEFLSRKDEMMKSIKDTIRRRIKFSKDKELYSSKYWYYVYLTNCIISNESFDLSDEQIEILNMLHDRKEETYDIRKQLVDDMVEEINHE